MLQFTQFCNFYKALKKATFLKIAAQAFEAGNFHNIFLRLGGFEAHFLIKNCVS